MQGYKAVFATSKNIQKKATNSNRCPTLAVKETMLCLCMRADPTYSLKRSEVLPQIESAH